MPDQQAAARQRSVRADLLPVFEQPVLVGLAGIEAVDGVGPVLLHIRQADRPVVPGDIHHRIELQVHARPGVEMRRGVAQIAVPRPAGHQAPIANTPRGVVNVVQVGQAEGVTQLVHVDAVRHIAGREPELRLGRIRTDAHAVHQRLVVRPPRVRPDRVRVAAVGLRAGAGVNDEDGIHIAVAVVVVVGEVHHRVDQRHHVLSQALAVLRVAAQAVVTVSIVSVGLRSGPPADGAGQVERDNIQQAVAHFLVVAAHGPAARPKDQRIEERRAHLGRLVGELHQDGQRAEGIGRGRFKAGRARRTARE